MQVAFMLGRHQVFLELPEEMDDYEDFTEILSNSHLNTHFLSLGREVGASCLCMVFAMISFKKLQQNALRAKRLTFYLLRPTYSPFIVFL